MISKYYMIDNHNSYLKTLKYFNSIGYFISEHTQDFKDMELPTYLGVFDDVLIFLNYPMIRKLNIEIDTLPNSNPEFPCEMLIKMETNWVTKLVVGYYEDCIEGPYLVKEYYPHKKQGHSEPYYKYKFYKQAKRKK